MLRGRNGADGRVGVERYPKSCQDMAKSHSAEANAGSVRLSLWFGDSSPSSSQSLV
jgi:hypothetical protein